MTILAIWMIGYLFTQGMASGLGLNDSCLHTSRIERLIIWLYTLVLWPGILGEWLGDYLRHRGYQPSDEGTSGVEVTTPPR